MAEIFTTSDGSHSLLSDKFGVSYHSKHGAITESEHVFLEAAFRQKTKIQPCVDVLEIGFGSGLNAFMTFLEAKKTNIEVNYTTFEAYPISIEKSKKLNFAEMLSVENINIFNQMHTSNWNEEIKLSPYFTFTKFEKEFESIDYQTAFDIIYFDAFAPTAQPELWNEPFLKKMYDALRPNGILTTYCAKGVVKRALKSLGFVVETLPGPPGKREMTRAIRI